MLAILSFVLINTAVLAEVPSGCLIANGKKVGIDTFCKCLETKSCLTPKKFGAGKTFFETRDAKDRKLFSDKEKLAYEESFKITNTIMELNSKGLGNSEEAKKAYFQLDKVNAEISILLFKNHPDVMKKIAKNYKEKSKIRKEERLQLEKRALAFVNNKSSESTKFSLEPELAAKPEPVLKPVKESAPVSAKTSIGHVAAVEKTDGISEEEKSFILDNIKVKDNKVQENDSLFEIVSKTYKARAYQQLLAPKEYKEK